MHAGADFSFSRLLRYNLSNEWTEVDRETDRIGQGYSVYVAHSDVVKWRNPNAPVKEYLVPDVSTKGLYLECYRDKINPFAGCQCLTTFGRNLSLSVSFRRSQFERWREMLRATEELLISFKQ